LRRDNPILRRGRFLSGAYNPALDIKDVTWLTPAGEEMSEANWKDPLARSLGVLLNGRAQPTGIRQRGTDVTLLLILNAYHDTVAFRLPKVAGGRNGAGAGRHQSARAGGPKLFRSGHEYLVTGRSLLLFRLLRENNRKVESADGSGRAARNRASGT
jgi:isoamylase